MQEDNKSSKSNKSLPRGPTKNFIKLNKKQLDKIQNSQTFSKPNILKQKKIKLKVKSPPRLISNNSFYKKSVLWKKHCEAKKEIKQMQLEKAFE